MQTIPRHPSVVIDRNTNTTKVDQCWVHFDEYVVHDMVLGDHQYNIKGIQQFH